MRFQPGEGPSRGLLRDCTTGCGTDRSICGTTQHPPGVVVVLHGQPREHWLLRHLPRGAVILPLHLGQVPAHPVLPLHLLRYVPHYVLSPLIIWVRLVMYYFA